MNIWKKIRKIFSKDWEKYFLKEKESKKNVTWWTSRDLNSGPLLSQRSALPSCATRPLNIGPTTAI